jgi:hypothetical protein
MKPTIKRLLQVCLGGYVLLALLILCAYVGGKISVRSLGLEYAALFVIAVIAVTIVVGRHKQADPVKNGLIEPFDTLQAKAARKTIRNYKIAILFMCVILIYGIWDSKEFPLWVTLVGAAVNIAITLVLVRIVRVKKAELPQ